MNTYQKNDLYRYGIYIHVQTLCIEIVLISLSGLDTFGKPVFLRDIWPSRQQVQEIERQYVVPAMFKETYAKITEGNRNWNALKASESMLYPWNHSSTYIKSPPFFDDMTSNLPPLQSIANAHVLLNLGDSVTTGIHLNMYMYL